MDTTQKYDSTQDTLDHIDKVRTNLEMCVLGLRLRAKGHDQSKLKPPEKDIFDSATTALKGLTYGSDEYKEQLTKMQPALEHHYSKNSHHPEHYVNGIDGMDLLDVLEMLCDWQAATQRHADGNLAKSLKHNMRRFKISPQLQSILANTAFHMNWIDRTDYLDVLTDLQLSQMT